MTSEEYQKLAVKSEPLELSLTKSKLQNQNYVRGLHHALGIGTKVIELQYSFKRALFYNTALDIINIKEELGDVMWYIAGMCNTFGFSLEEVMQINIDKLKKRFPNNFNENDAINRNLDEERKVLEQKD